MLNRFPVVGWPRHHVHWDVVRISVKRVSCYNGNNDRSGRVLFVQHPREQGEWVRPNPRYARFDCIIRSAPSGTGRTAPSQPGHYPLIKSIADGDITTWMLLIYWCWTQLSFRHMCIWQGCWAYNENSFLILTMSANCAMSNYSQECRGNVLGISWIRIFVL